MAVSGTVILLALRLQRSFPHTQFPVHEIPPSPPPILRSCISSGTRSRGEGPPQGLIVAAIALFSEMIGHKVDCLVNCEEDFVDIVG
ncbi:hypothetical protein SESBI_00065 [Sesbania bispinosa]|nr:hypothetical protein SESBI_00065 [Sesbania bispinosa]